jgi:hypothetical protein
MSDKGFEQNQVVCITRFGEEPKDVVSLGISVSEDVE